MCGGCFFFLGGKLATNDGLALLQIGVRGKGYCLLYGIRYTVELSCSLVLLDVIGMGGSMSVPPESCSVRRGSCVPFLAVHCGLDSRGSSARVCEWRGGWR